MITIWVPKRLVEVDLYNVAARSPQALAQLSENSYARRVQYAAQKVRGSGAKIVMLTGPGRCDGCIRHPGAGDLSAGLACPHGRRDRTDARQPRIRCLPAP